MKKKKKHFNNLQINNQNLKKKEEQKYNIINFSNFDYQQIKPSNITAEQELQYRKDRANVFETIEGLKKDKGKGKSKNNEIKEVSYNYFEISQVQSVIKKATKDKFYYEQIVLTDSIITNIVHIETGITNCIKSNIHSLKDIENIRIEYGKLQLKTDSNKTEGFMKGMSSAQVLGSLITYIKKYTLVSYFGLSEEDNDGNEPKKIEISAEEIITMIEKCKNFGENLFDDKVFCELYKIEKISLDQIKTLDQDKRFSAKQSLESKLNKLEKRQKQNKPTPSNQII